MGGLIGGGSSVTQAPDEFTGFIPTDAFEGTQPEAIESSLSESQAPARRRGGDKNGSFVLLSETDKKKTLLGG